VLAHGGPHKVVDGRVVISLVLVPRDEALALRFAFGDVRSGQPLSAPVVFRVMIREDQGGQWSFESPRMETTGGTGELVHRFPRDGFYEVFLEFERGDEPGRIYRPEDWRVWIGSRGDSARPWVVASLELILVASAALCWWQRQRGVRRRGAALSGGRP